MDVSGKLLTTSDLDTSSEMEGACVIKFETMDADDFKELQIDAKDHFQQLQNFEVKLHEDNSPQTLFTFEGDKRDEGCLDDLISENDSIFDDEDVNEEPDYEVFHSTEPVESSYPTQFIQFSGTKECADKNVIKLQAFNAKKIKSEITTPEEPKAANKNRYDVSKYRSVNYKDYPRQKGMFVKAETADSDEEYIPSGFKKPHVNKSNFCLRRSTRKRNIEGHEHTLGSNCEILNESNPGHPRRWTNRAIPSSEASSHSLRNVGVQCSVDRVDVTRYGILEEMQLINDLFKLEVQAILSKKTRNRKRFRLPSESLKRHDATTMTLNTLRIIKKEVVDNNTVEIIVGDNS